MRNCIRIYIFNIQKAGDVSKNSQAAGKLLSQKLSAMYAIRDDPGRAPGHQMPAHIILRMAMFGKYPVAKCGSRLSPKKWMLVSKLPGRANLCQRCKRIEEGNYVE